MATSFRLIPVNVVSEMLGVRQDGTLGLVKCKGKGNDALVLLRRPVLLQTVKLYCAGTEIFFAPDDNGQLRLVDPSLSASFSVLLEAGNEGDTWRFSIDSASGRKYLRHSNWILRFDAPSGELFLSDSCFRLISFTGEYAIHETQLSRPVRTRQSSKIEKPTQFKQTPAKTTRQLQLSRSSFKCNSNWTYSNPIQIGDLQVSECAACKHADLAIELTVGSLVIHEVDAGDAYERDLQTPYHIAVVLGFTRGRVILSFLKDVVRVAESGVRIPNTMQGFSGSVVASDEIYTVPCTTILKKIQRLNLYDAEMMKIADDDQLPHYAYVFVIRSDCSESSRALGECEWKTILTKCIERRNASCITKRVNL
jgi:hypothetical protein